MQNDRDEFREIKQAAPPEVPPLFPPEAPRSPAVPVPMIYVDAPEKIEYRVTGREGRLEAKDLENELNGYGKEGWQLLQIFREDDRHILVFSRRLRD